MLPWKPSILLESAWISALRAPSFGGGGGDAAFERALRLAGERGSRRGGREQREQRQRVAQAERWEVARGSWWR